VTRKMRAPVWVTRLPAWGAAGSSTVMIGRASAIFTSGAEQIAFGSTPVPASPNRRDASAERARGGR